MSRIVAHFGIKEVASTVHVDSGRVSLVAPMRRTGLTNRKGVINITIPIKTVFFISL